MSESPTAIVRALFDRANSGDIDAVLELLAPDSVMDVPPEASAEPDTYEGHEGARRYFAGFDGVLDDVRFDLLAIEEVSPDTVLTDARLSGRGTTTGIFVEQSTFVVLTVRDGRISSIRPYASREAALAGVRSGSR
jgi:ketosteroid isomerase-like protein